jgi:hypothetical protein
MIMVEKLDPSKVVLQSNIPLDTATNTIPVILYNWDEETKCWTPEGAVRVQQPLEIANDIGNPVPVTFDFTEALEVLREISDKLDILVEGKKIK